MYAIVTSLDADQDKQTRTIWNKLSDQCKLVGMEMFPLPHFSWQGAESYDLIKVKEVLGDFCQMIEPFQVITAGLGLFTGNIPVLYISVVKNRQLLELHERLWSITKIHSANRNLYYAPEEWIPHITVAYKDVTPEKLGCAVEDVLYTPIKFTVEVNSVSMVHAVGEDIGIDWKINFGRGE